MESSLPASADPKRDLPLAHADGYAFVLNGMAAAPAPQMPSTLPGFPLWWAAFAVCAAGVLGLGAAAWFGLSRLAGGAGAIALSIVPLLGALVIAAATSFATWTQVPLPRGALVGLGLAALAAVALQAVFARRPLLAVGSALPPRWETVLLLALLLLVLARVAAFPIVAWDGRSIWLFNAKRVLTQGMFLKADLTRVDSLWAHPDYPLLFPAWMATFASFGSGFNERMASLGIPLLMGAALLPFWQLARGRTGRIVGSLLTLSLTLAVDRVTGGGYADGYLMLFLMAEFLALGSPATEAVGWVAGTAAALTKSEGIVLAGIVALCVVCLTPAWKGRPWWRRLVPLLWLLPALAHKLWALSNGVDTIGKGKAIAAIVAGFFPRLSEVLHLAPSLLAADGYTHVRGLLWDGLFGLGATLVLWACRGRPLGRLVWAALAAAALQATFAVVTIAALPESVEFLVVTALDRLLLHPSALLVLAPFLYAATIKDPGEGTATLSSPA